MKYGIIIHVEPNERVMAIVIKAGDQLYPRLEISYISRHCVNHVVK